MSLLKYIDRLKRIDDLILHESTGTADEFARALGISVSVLKENLNEMRILGAEIEFCRIRKSYLYRGKKRLILKFESLVTNDKALRLKGGKFIDYWDQFLLYEHDQTRFLYTNFLKDQ